MTSHQRAYYASVTPHNRSQLDCLKQSSLTAKRLFRDFSPDIDVEGLNRVQGIFTVHSSKFKRLHMYLRTFTVSENYFSVKWREEMTDCLDWQWTSWRRLFFGRSSSRSATRVTESRVPDKLFQTITVVLFLAWPWAILLLTGWSADAWLSGGVAGASAGTREKISNCYGQIVRRNAVNNIVAWSSLSWDELTGLGMFLV